MKFFFKEVWQFLQAHKKFWLVPIVVVVVLFGGLLIAATIAPTVYVLR